MQTIILGGGCFWCTESVFQSVKGVQKVTSGYMGGTAATANYETVCSGDTDHIEVIQVEFDDTVIPLEVMLDVFFTTHDPTSFDRQGNDIGKQYRSIIFYTDETQKPTIEDRINHLKDQGVNVVTQVEPSSEFFEAEAYHQDFYNKNPTQGYCQFAIPPKLAKLRQQFKPYLK